MSNEGPQMLLASLEGQLEEVRDLRDEARALAARQLLPGSTALVLAQLPREVTLAIAATRIAEAYNLLHGGAFNRVARRGADVHLITDDRDFAFTVEDPETILDVMEQTLFFTHAMLVLIAPETAQRALAGVSLRRSRGTPSVPFGQMAAIRRDAAVYSLRYDAALADKPVTRPAREDLTFEAVIRTQIALLRAEGGPASFGDQTLAALRGGAADQAGVALRLGISPATLRRRLAAEGLSFRDLRQDVMRERADALLKTGLPLPEIAERLGFSDVRSFNRAYAARSGLTPAAMRRRAD